MERGLGGQDSKEKSQLFFCMSATICLCLWDASALLCAYSIVEQQWSYNCRMEEVFGLAKLRQKHTHIFHVRK
jgi:hypothetical protein